MIRAGERGRPRPAGWRASARRTYGDQAPLRGLPRGVLGVDRGAQFGERQVQMWLGHSDPGFTLRTYVHLIDDGLGDADFLDAAGWATPRATRATETQAKPVDGEPREMAL